MVKKKYPIILSIIGLIFTILVLLIPFFTKYLVNEAITVSNMENKVFDNLIKYIIIIISLTILAIIVKIFDNFLYSIFYINEEKKLRNILFSNISFKALDSLSLYKVGDIEVLYGQDIKNVIKAKLTILPSLIKQISRALLSLILLFILDDTKYKLMIIILLSIGILALIGARFYSKIIKPHHKKVLELDSIASNFFIESYSHHKQIIAYDGINRSIEYYNILNEDAKKAKRKRNNIIYTANSLVYAFISIVYAICIILGAYLIAKNIYTAGSLIAIIQLINNIEAPFLSLSSLITNYNLGKTSEERLKQLFDLENINLENEINDFDSIEFENVTFSYDKENIIINNLNFNINKGDIVKIDGPSGIGKTTLLMLLLGFLKPDSGNISFKLNDKLYKTSLSRNLFSYLSQENILFSASIRENIYILTGIKDEDKINEALKLANIYDEIMNLKDKLDTKLNNNSGLSLGQIQRILIAILILYDKPILLLDEFSSSLDKNNEEIIFNNLVKFNKTIIYITHRNINNENEKIIKIK